MAKYVVPSRKEIIIKCDNCKTLYVPDKKTYHVFYEKCPICGCATNSNIDRISLWHYNLIKWFRGGFKK